MWPLRLGSEGVQVSGCREGSSLGLQSGACQLFVFCGPCREGTTPETLKEPERLSTVILRVPFFRIQL